MIIRQVVRKYHAKCQRTKGPSVNKLVIMEQIMVWLCFGYLKLISKDLDDILTWFASLTKSKLTRGITVDRWRQTFITRCHHNYHLLRGIFPPLGTEWVSPSGDTLPGLWFYRRGSKDWSLFVQVCNVYNSALQSNCRQPHQNILDLERT